MPPSMVKTKEEEADWSRAKKIVCASGADGYAEACAAAERGEKSEDTERFYALVTTIYNSIRKGRAAKAKETKEGVALDWFALSEAVPGATPAPMPPEQLSQGDRVRVVTRLGRTIATGTVQHIEMMDSGNSEVIVMDVTGRVRSFPILLYRFVRAEPESTDREAAEGAGAAVGEASGPGVSYPDNRGELPIQKPGSEDNMGLAREIIRSFVDGDRRKAASIWSDLTDSGIGWARRRSPEIPAPVWSQILAALMSAGVLHPGVGRAQDPNLPGPNMPGMGLGDADPGDQTLQTGAPTVGQP